MLLELSPEQLSLSFKFMWPRFQSWSGKKKPYEKERDREVPAHNKRRDISGQTSRLLSFCNIGFFLGSSTGMLEGKD